MNLGGEQRAIARLSEAVDTEDLWARIRVDPELHSAPLAPWLSTVLKVDKLYAIDAGRVAETGKYQAPMAQNGLFASMTRRQLA